jgi:hypothetical protein
MRLLALVERSELLQSGSNNIRPCQAKYTAPKDDGRINGHPSCGLSLECGGGWLGSYRGQGPWRRCVVRGDDGMKDAALDHQ